MLLFLIALAGYRLRQDGQGTDKKIYLTGMIRKLLFAILLLPAVTVVAQKSKSIAVIFDSDMGPDYDDVGAITLLHAFADSGKVKILATVASTKYEGVAAVFDVFNTYFKRPNTIIGVPRGKALELKDWQHWTDSLIANYPHRVQKNAEVPDAVEVYRKVLAAQPNGSVTIITTGFLTNLANLLRSGPDQYSPLKGDELVKKKVKHLVAMAGRFPTGSEFNLNRDVEASAYVANNWNTPIIFSGFEIGQAIHTGLPIMHNDRITHSPVKDVFSLCIPKAAEDSAGRMSWDETAVLVAIKGVKPWYKLENGQLTMNADGSNGWQTGPGLHSRLIAVIPPIQVENLLNKLFMHQPKK
jgi:pyrimidine-specific ribonucleoside hydrolase